MELSQGKSIAFTLREEKGVLKSDEPTILHEHTVADSDIVATCEFESHGHWDGPTSKAATLFVIRFDLSSHAGRKFLTFEPLFELKPLPTAKKQLWESVKSWFRREQPTRPKTVPAVVDQGFEPGAKGRMIVQEVRGETERESVYQASLGLSAPPPVPVSGSVSASKRENKKLPENYRYEISAGLRNQRHTVYWEARQHEDLGEGIDKVKVAFLVFRDDNEDFAFDLTLGASADFVYDLSNHMLPWRAKKEVIIRPSRSANNECPPNVDGDHLCKLKENRNKGLVELTHIHVGEKWVDPLQNAANTGSKD